MRTMIGWIWSSGGRRRITVRGKGPCGSVSPPTRPIDPPLRPAGPRRSLNRSRWKLYECRAACLSRAGRNVARATAGHGTALKVTTPWSVPVRIPVRERAAIGQRVVSLRPRRRVGHNVETVRTGLGPARSGPAAVVGACEIVAQEDLPITVLGKLSERERIACF